MTADPISNSDDVLRGPIEIAAYAARRHFHLRGVAGWLPTFSLNGKLYASKRAIDAWFLQQEVKASGGLQ